MSESLLQLVTNKTTYSFGSLETSAVDKSPSIEKTKPTLFSVEYPSIDQIIVNQVSSSSLQSSNLSIMNSQLNANDPSSNLHLLSKVIEATESDTMNGSGQRVMNGTASTSSGTTTILNPKRVSLPLPYLNKPDGKAINKNETPTTCVNDDDRIIRTNKSWKKKVILAMGKEEIPTIHTHNLMSNTNHSTLNIDHNDEPEKEAITLDMNISGNNSSYSLLNSMTVLPPTFRPGPHDVLCGRGRACKDAPGNKAYREIIMNQLQIYAESTTKSAKGQIISNIMEQIKRQCHTYHKDTIGGFVKQSNGRWYDVGDFLAREKTSQCFRDALAALYSSSAQSKYLRRRASKDLTTKDHEIKDQMDVATQNKYAHSNQISVAVGKIQKAIEAHEKEVELTNSAQQPTKKARLHPPEKTAVDALQQMASLSGDEGVKCPLSCSPSPDSLPKLTSNPTSASTCDTSNSTLKLFDYSNKLPAPSIITSVGKRLESRSVILPRRDSYRTRNVSNGAMDLHMRTNATSAAVVCALQVALRPPEESPWDALVRIERQMESIAASDSVDVFVLPELAPIGYSEDTFSKYLPINITNQAMYQEFDRFFQLAARKFNTYICYGTVGWSYDNRNMAMVRLGLPSLFIRQVVVDRLGTQVACYDKTYLCNYGECAESRYFQPGPASVPTSFPVYSRDRTCVYRFGLLICSDMRNPNLARTLTADPEHCVDCILQPSAFARDCSFRTWSSFRETRAVENSIFWIGINYAGTNYGETTIVPPFVEDDHEPISLECEEGYVIGRVARSTLDYARTQFPFYRNLLMEESMKLRK